MHVHLAVDDERRVAVERRHGSDRQATVLVGVAEHELAGAQHPPAAAPLRQPVARARLGAAALDHRLGDAVLEAELVAAAFQHLRALLVHHGHGAAEGVLEPRAAAFELRVAGAVERHQHVRLARPEAGVPVRRSAVPAVAEQLGARRHALAEVLRERVQHRRGHAEGGEPRIREREVDRGLGRRALPQLRRHHLVDQPAQPLAPARGVVHAHEHVRPDRMRVAAQQVALEVGRVHDGAAPPRPPRQQAWSRARALAQAHAVISRNAACSAASSSVRERTARSAMASATRWPSRTSATVARG